MTPIEIKQARKSLGLTQAEMGRMLDIQDQNTYRKYEMPVSARQHRVPAARMVRLIRAYLDGFRPEDWPA